MTDPSLDALLQRCATVACLGAGGVGKTTVAAALAVRAAQLGRRAAVVTIDPARRLADALGAGALGNAPRLVAGDWPGELWAVMLDTKATFDELVARHAADADQAARILANRFYRNVSEALAGTQEYMAMEKLYELQEEHGFDLVVVDTPPSRHALDFLRAPNQLGRLLDHRAYRLLTARGVGAAKVVNRAAQSFVRLAARAVGAEVLDDAVAFFAAFDGMEHGFRARELRARHALEGPGAAFVLVAGPRRASLEEADWLADRLGEQGISVGVLVVNRVQPSFAGGSPEALAELLAAPGPPARQELAANLAELRAAAELEAHELARLSGRRCAGGLVLRAPLFADDVHELAALERLAAALE
ncbi:MAG: ArsA family ATPase [Acidimicrobiales bacterium]